MRKLPEVQDAKDVMNEALDWSTFKWLWEKTRVRQTADRANAVLEHQERAIKGKWSDECKAVYKNLSGKKAVPPKTEQEPTPPSDNHMAILVEKVLEADQAAERARVSAEDIFDQAEKQMSTDLARQGCKKAVHSWELREKAIRRAEAVAEACHASQANIPPS